MVLHDGEPGTVDAGVGAEHLRGRKCFISEVYVLLLCQPALYNKQRLRLVGRRSTMRKCEMQSAK